MVLTIVEDGSVMCPVTQKSDDHSDWYGNQDIVMVMILFASGQQDAA